MRVAGPKGRLRIVLAALLLLAPGLTRDGTGWAQVTMQAGARDRFFVSGDGVRLHYIEAGQGPTIVFVPGWTMPAWIFQPQIAAFARAYHVVAFDPRSQGDSDIAPGGHEPVRRGEDIADLLRVLGPRPVLLVGWSLGVLDSLSYLRLFGDGHLAGLVLIDNSVGEDPPPPPARPRPPSRRLPREVLMRAFVASMFRHRQNPDFIERLTEASLRTPLPAASALLAYPVPRSYWKDAVYSTRKPILYVVTSRLAGQAENLGRYHPSARTAVFADAGHALFVDDAGRFNALMDDFIRTEVWPGAAGSAAAGSAATGPGAATP